MLSLTIIYLSKKGHLINSFYINNSTHNPHLLFFLMYYAYNDFLVFFCIYIYVYINYTSFCLSVNIGQCEKEREREGMKKGALIVV